MYGRPIPSTSMQHPIVFALSIYEQLHEQASIKTNVYIPPQAPLPGHEWRTTSKNSSSGIWPVSRAPAARQSSETLQCGPSDRPSASKVVPTLISSPFF